jgi:hypothetical protein
MRRHVCPPGDPNHVCPDPIFPNAPDGTTVFQTIRPITTQFIIFAGGSSEFNGGPATGSYSPIPDPLIQTNTAIALEIVALLKRNPEYWVNFHGHANPITPTDLSEIAELEELSLDRARAVREHFRNIFVEAVGELHCPHLPNSPPEDCDCYGCTNFNRRTRAFGFGGEHMQIDNDGSMAYLNRRVEIIVFTIETHQD